MIWNAPSNPTPPADDQPRPSRAPAPAPEPARAAPAAGGDVAQPRRGTALALIGLPESGKTSFLYSLKHVPQRPTGLRWSWPAASKELAEMAGRPGEPLPGTTPGTFKVSELSSLHRPWRWLSGLRLSHLLCPRRRVMIPEVSGEQPKQVSGASEPTNDKERWANEQLEKFLAVSEEILFLAGLVDYRSPRPLTQDSVERVLLDAATALARIEDRARALRGDGSRRSPVFVTFLITKRDVLKDSPGLDAVRVRAAGSALLKLAGTPGRDWLNGGMVTRDETDVRFNLNQVCDAAGSDIEVQEAAACDFLACHAPKAGMELSSLAHRRGVSLRILTSKPFGRECRTADGLTAAHPEPQQLETSMVWEPLDDLVERSYRYRARQRLKKAGIAAAFLLAAVTLFGPALSAWTNRQASSALAAKNRAQAESWLLADDWNPWSHMARLGSPRHAYASATLWAELGNQMPLRDGERDRVEREIAKRDPTPGQSLVKPFRDDRYKRALSAFLGQSPGDGKPVAVSKERDLLRDLPELLVQPPRDPLALSSDQAKSVFTPVLTRPDSAPVQDPPGTTVESDRLGAIANNVERLRSWMQAGGGPVDGGKRAEIRVFDGPGAAGSGRLEAEIRGGLAAAGRIYQLRANLAKLRLDSQSPTAADLQSTQELLVRARELDDAKAVEFLQEGLRTQVGRRFASLLANEMQNKKQSNVKPVGAAYAAGTVECPASTSPDIHAAYRDQAVQATNEMLGTLAKALVEMPGAKSSQHREFAAAWSRYAQALQDPTLGEWTQGAADLAKGLQLLSRLSDATAGSSDPRTISGLLDQVRIDGEVTCTVSPRDGSVLARGEHRIDLGPPAKALWRAAVERLSSAAESGAVGIVGSTPGAAGRAKTALDERAKVVARTGVACPADRKGLYELVELGLALEDDDHASEQQGSRVAALLDAWLAAGAADKDAEMVLARIAKLNEGATWAPGIVATLVSRGKGNALVELYLGESSIDWSRVSPAKAKGLEESLKKTERSIIPFVVAEFDANVPGKGTGQGGQDAAGSQVRRLALVAEVQGRKIDEVARLQDFLRAVAEEAASRSMTEPGMGPLESALGEMQKAGLASEQAKQLLDALDEHRELIRKWDLLPVHKDGAVVCYLARLEWTRDNVLSVAPKLQLHPASSTAKLETNLGISLQDARDVAAKANLRLPKKGEWLLAFNSAPSPKDRAQEVAESVALNVKWQSDCSVEFLRDQLQDSRGSGWIGMQWGVREWCDDAEQPSGLSNRWKFADQLVGKELRAGQPVPPDVGMRPALDPLPLAVRQRILAP